MSYALRNSLIIGVLLLFVVGLGFYWVGVRKTGKIEALQTQRGELEYQLEIINSVLAIYDSTLAELNRMRARWQAQTQIVPAADSPDRTLAYLDGCLKLAKGRVNFDFLYKGGEAEDDYSVNIYGIEGEGKFKNLYAFIWHLEHGHRFYTVDRLQINYREPDSGERTDRWDWVKFRMVFRAYFEPQSRVEDLPPSSSAAPPEALARDLFRPLIARTLPENRLGLFDVEGARLKGLTYDVAYLEDSEKRMHLLREGERVFMGKLSQIDIFRNRVEFLLNKGGIWERLTLTIERDAAQE